MTPLEAVKAAGLKSRIGRGPGSPRRRNNVKRWASIDALMDGSEYTGETATLFFVDLENAARRDLPADKIRGVRVLVRPVRRPLGPKGKFLFLMEFLLRGKLFPKPLYLYARRKVTVTVTCAMLRTSYIYALT
jgi:hypothetical protein